MTYYKMYWKWLLQKCIGNDFYCKNALTNDFYYKNALEMIFTIKMHWKWLI